MNIKEATLLEHEICAAIAACKSVEDLNEKCIEVTKRMNFDYFLYRIQYPTPFTNPRTKILGNYPLGKPTPKATNHRTTGHLKIDSEQLKSFNSMPITSRKIESHSKIYFFTQSAQKNDGIHEQTIIARTGRKITQPELVAVRALINSITTEIYNKLLAIDGQNTKAVVLTPREKEILLWGADGKTSEEIAMILGLSPNSVNFHHKTIQKKLGTSNRAQAIAHAIIKGYL